MIKLFFRMLFFYRKQERIEKASKLLEVDGLSTEDRALAIGMSVISEALFNENLLELREEYRDYKKLIRKHKV